MAIRTLIKTGTAGWYEDPTNPGTKTRKKDGDVVLTREQYEDAQEGDTTAVVAEKAKQQVQGTVLSTGKLAKGPTVEITCRKPGCSSKRVIQVQDKFQVQFCIPHQKERRNELRKKRRQAAKA